MNGSEYPNISSKYGSASPEHVLIDSCADIDDPKEDATLDWWLSPNGATEDEAYFVIDLGCQKCVSTVTVTNSGNGKWQNRFLKLLNNNLALSSDKLFLN